MPPQKKANKTTPAALKKSSSAEYFSKNLQQVGFSSPAKAVLTTLKEAVDNALDACEEHGILPDISIDIVKLGSGGMRNHDRILVSVEDNGPGLDTKAVPMVFGEYLASSKFGQGRCSRGQQGIGISAATTWATQSAASGAQVLTKQAGQRKALSCLVVTDLKKNRGLLKEKNTVDWDKPHGTRVSFLLEGRIQLNGEGGLLTYIRGNILLNPHMTLRYRIPDREPVKIERVSEHCPRIPPAQPPHPHTMKLGEFISHAHLWGKHSVREWFKSGFSRMGEKSLDALFKACKWGPKKQKAALSSLSSEDLSKLFEAVQHTDIRAPSTDSVMSIGEDALSLSISRLGEVDYFSVVSLKPVICDFKPVQIEVAMARFKDKSGDSEGPVQLLRFANRVPLQFDKASCAISKATCLVNWKAYGLKQSRGLFPSGPYIIAVSIIAPFIKFKNASKETIDASEELVEEIRRALMKAGLKLSKHLKREHRAKELNAKVQHIEKFSPILVETLCRILDASEKRREKAYAGVSKILGEDYQDSHDELKKAEEKLQIQVQRQEERLAQLKEGDSLPG